MQRLMFVLSGEHPTLPAAEAAAAIKAEHRAFKVLEQLDQVLVAETKANPEVLASRLAMCRGICLHLCTSGATEGEILEVVGSSDIVDLIPHGKTFAVHIKRVKRSAPTIDTLGLSRKLAELVAEEVEFEVDLAHPDVELLGVLTGERCVLGITAARVDRSQFTKRRPTARPAFHPSTLPPAFARCMVNLARTPRGGTLLDPFCLAPDTKILLASGSKTLEELENCWRDEHVMAYDGNGLTRHKASRYIKIDPGEYGLATFNLVTEGGRKICATGNHAFYTPVGWVPLSKLRTGDKVAVYPRMGPEVDTQGAHDEPICEDYFRRSFPQHRELKVLKNASNRQKAYVFENTAGPENRILSGTPLPQSRLKHRYNSDCGGMPVGQKTSTYVVDNPEAAMILSEDDVRKAIPPSSDSEYIIQILKTRGLVPFTIWDKRLPIVSRLLGHLFTDGYLLLHPRVVKELYRKKNGETTIHKYKTVDTRVGFITGIEEDLKAIESDLQLLGFAGSSSSGIFTQIIDGRKFTSRKAELRSSSKPLWVFFSALGAPVGDKTRAKMVIPQWLHIASPLARQEFLRGLFGGDGSRIRVRVRDRKNYPPNEGICAPYLTFRKIEQLKSDGIEYARQIANLLDEFGIKSKIKCYENIGSKQKDGNKTITFRVYISQTHKFIYNFCENIGYSYARSKDTAAMLVREYLRMRKRTSTLGDAGAVRTGRVPKFSEWVKKVTKDLNGGLVWDTVKSISNEEIPEVRDLTIQDRHNFIANGFLVHNCGVGGILLEAGLIGAKLVGVDIEREMIEGARKNLEASGITDFQLMVGDARKLPALEVDAIATDPPYGRQATTGGAELEELYREALPSMAKVLKRRSYACVTSPAELELDEMAAGAGLRTIEKHEQRVHRSLTRRIYVFRRK